MDRPRRQRRAQRLLRHLRSSRRAA